MTKKERNRLDKYYQKKYGVSWNQRQEMLKSQHYKCALCSKPEKDCAKRLHVDHSHATKKTRGLVCYFCNVHRIGRLNLKWAKELVKYFERYE